MPEHYTREEIAGMDDQEYGQAASRGFLKPVENTTVNFGGELVMTDTPTLPASPPQDPYDWGTDNTYDYPLPSGKLCRMKPLSVKDLVSVGIIDQVTRLQGLADRLVQKASGEPPMAEKNDFLMMAEMFEKIIPMAVVKPVILPVPPGERVVGKIYVDTVEFGDQVAIANKALEGISKFDNFRE